MAYKKINISVVKKISLSLLAIFALLSVKAQLPDSWIVDTGIEIFQETEIVYSGNYSAGVIVNSGTQSNCDLINQTVIPVNPGENFKVSYWGITSPFVLARVFFYWEGTNSSFTSEYLGPGNQDWEEFTFEDIVPAGATSLKIGIRFYDVTGFTPGEIQYVDNVSFESPPGNSLSVINGDFETWALIKPEPSNFPTDFAGTQKSLSALLSWTDAIGDQLPDSYLIFGSKEQITALPEDGVYYPNDFDFTDGEAAVNVFFGRENFTFSGLEKLSNYYFKIFPYTNSGTNINYKSDGAPPETLVEIPDVSIIVEQNFDESWSEWETISIIGDQVWSRENNYGIQETPCARITGNNAGIIYENEDWIISPTMDFTSYENEFLSFYSSVGYISPEEQFSVKISTDYSGNGDPASASWTDLSPVLPDGLVNWSWTRSGEIDVSGFAGDNVHVAFVYVCGTETAATWQIDDVLITGIILPVPEPSNYPNDFLATVDSTNINLTWLDATGEIVPEAYLILGSDQDNISIPQDGTPVEDDTDFSDGVTSMNILPGMQATTFAGLISGNTYYFKIFPYTNSGNLIDYKTDGESPSTQGFIQAPVDILFTDFNNNWGSWSPLSIVGIQAWSRNNTSGLEDSPCALISGFEGGAKVNEDWLISPAVELSGTANIKAGFYNATENTGQQILMKLSLDYPGTGNPNEYTWVDLSERVNWSSGEFSWTHSGDIVLTEYSGSTIYLAFIYFSDNGEAARWGIDDIKVSEIPVINEPTNYPTNFAAEAEVKEITLTWQDAVGEIEPWGYLLQVSEQDVFSLPENGIPIADDLDFSDGNGSVNLLPGTETYTFVGLADSTKYFATIIPYTNSDPFIKYKTIPEPPKSFATTAPPDGIGEFTTNPKLNIYPNPGNGLLYFKANDLIQSIRVYSIDGKLIFDNEFSASTGQIDLRGLEKGAYIALFKIDGKISLKQQIIIQ